jgi:hypothetical protein
MGSAPPTFDCMNTSPIPHQHPSPSPVIEGESPAGRPQLARKALIAEIERYLEAVECFRALDCEPAWRSDRSWVTSAASRFER